MKEKIIARLKGRRYNSHILRLVVGGYLLYLAYSLFKGMADVEGSRLLFTGFALVFAAVGLVLVSMSLLAMYKGWFIERAAAEEEQPGDQNE